MSQRSFAVLYRMLSGFIAFCLLSADLAGAAALIDIQLPSSPALREGLGEGLSPEEQALFRTRVTLRQPRDLSRVRELGAVVLSADETSALLLVTAHQLADLARLRFAPTASDELGTLLLANGATGLLAELGPVLEQAAAIQTADGRPLIAAENSSQSVSGSVGQSSDGTQAAVGGRPSAVALAGLLASITPAQQAAIEPLAPVDTDSDGLTDTQEGWWCTNAAVANSDGTGANDGAEVTALLDFTLSRTVRWGHGAPFGPPAAWPDFNNRDGNPNTPACNDGDYDTIPDFAEVFMIGSRVPEETTDLDKFDDGQELFGTTFCPGGTANCDYGSYPRIEYWNYIKASMPSWVQPPGDNLFVAAFPVPEVSVVAGSWSVERVETITTELGEMTETTNSYATTVTEGTGSSIADTRSWNNWEEVSQSVETPIAGGTGAAIAPAGGVGQALWGTAKIAAGVLSIGAGCTFGAITVVGCAAGIAGGVVGIGDGLLDWKEALTPDEAQTEVNINNVNSIYNHNEVSSSSTSNASIVLNQSFDTQGITNALSGVSYSIARQGELMAQALHDVSYAISQPRFTETKTNGRSWGGAQTTTHEVYEEHAITNGQQFTTGQNWSTAWAVESDHVANLTFTYRVDNTGTEYFRELTGLAFNIYLGDDATPIITYEASQQIGPINNFFPADNPVQRTSTPIALTLEQMKRIDLGEKLTIIVEDFSYGADENFYQDAINGGVEVLIEDGAADNDESVDRYVVPTWGVESVQDVLTRAFPATEDAQGNLIALKTAEFNGTQPPVWNEYALSDIAWWNVYQSCSSDCANVGATPLQEQQAQAGSSILFRFNRDSDRDGYKDNVEWRYGTDRNDPASHPTPEMLAGFTLTRNGNTVTGLLKLLNNGTFDAYGIDAVIYAPDDSITITNNTVGGNGRVRAGDSVAVGALIQPPDLANMGNSTAKVYAQGNYVGSLDRVYTFTVQNAGVVGAGNTSMTWSDGAGGSGVLPLGSAYHTPLPLPVANGLEVGLDSGELKAAASFTIQTLIPRDTFKFTINSEPYTPPVVVVSTSDPQGSHRFVTPVQLPDLEADLNAYSGQMLPDIGLSISANGPFAPDGANTTDFILYSPDATPIQGAKLYLDFVSDGKLVKEFVQTFDQEPGPTVRAATWSASSFNADYNPDGDNILLAFWTDAQDNIIDSAARPFNTFQDDPTAVLVLDAGDLAWNFGTAAQGTLLQHALPIGNTGRQTLWLRLGSSAGVSLSGPGNAVAPGDVGRYTVQINTADLPVGPYSVEIPLRTSDPANALKTLTIQGTVTPFVADDSQTATVRPLDVAVNVPGPISRGDTYEFTHNLGPDPASIHPCLVNDQTGTVLKGVGRHCADFGGVAGVPITDPSNPLWWTEPEIIPTRPLGALYGRIRLEFDANGVAHIVWQDQGPNGENDAEWGYTTRTTTGPQPAYTTPCPSPGTSNSVRSFEPDLAVADDGTVHVVWAEGWGPAVIYHAWKSPGGAWQCWDMVSHESTQSRSPRIAVDSAGGVHVVYTMHIHGHQPEVWYRYKTVGGGWSSACQLTDSLDYASEIRDLVVDQQDRVHMILREPLGGAQLRYLQKPARSGCSWSAAEPVGPTGVSIGYWDAITVDDQGTVHWSGHSHVPGTEMADDIWYQRRPVGGSWTSPENITASPGMSVVRDMVIDSAGTVYLFYYDGGLTLYKALPRGGSWTDSIVMPFSLGDLMRGAAIGPNDLFAMGWAESWSDIHFTFGQHPSHSAEQVEQPPFTMTRLFLPEAITSDTTYQVQYARRYAFALAGQQTASIRVDRQIYEDADLELLVSNAGAGGGPLNLCLDIGNDGSCDFSDNATTSFPAAVSVSNIEAALNAYLVAQAGVGWGNPVDVPMRVQVDRAAQVMLTNVQLSYQGQVAASMQVSSAGLPGKIVYMGTDEGHEAIYQINPDGTGKVRLTGTNPSRGNWPVYSPDGSMIAFEGYNVDYDTDGRLWVMNHDGTNPVQLSNVIPVHGQFLWTPSSDRIMFLSSVDGKAYTIRPDGTYLTEIPGWPLGGYLPRSWSPDGSRILTLNVSTNPYEIWWLNPDGSNPVPLTDGSSNDASPRLSPDGSRVAFESNRSGQDEIWVMNANGSNPTKITNSPGGKRSIFPEWSPDGSWILFSSDRDPAGFWDLIVVNSNGSNITNITTTPVVAEQVSSWGPYPPIQPSALIRYLRLSEQPYSQVNLTLRIDQPTLGNDVAFSVDVDADGSIEWSDSVAGPYPVLVTSPDLAAAVNGWSGGQDVPLRIVRSPAATIAPVTFTAVETPLPDAAIANADITLTQTNLTEGDATTINATVRSAGAAPLEDVTVAFFATLPNGLEWYLGSRYLPAVSSGGTPTSLVWDTTGFTGASTVKVRLDPYGTLPETNENNNLGSKAATIKTRPNLRPTGIVPATFAPVAGEALTVDVTIQNNGQTPSAAATCALYLGNPDDGGTLIGSQACGPLGANTSVMLTYPWTPAAAGPARLFARADSGGALLEPDEFDNDRWLDLEVTDRDPAPPFIPSQPTPADYTTGVAISTTLSWTGGDPNPGDTLTYEVYFGTANPPTTRVMTQSATSYDPPGDLAQNTTYFWQIIAKDNTNRTTSGPVWRFTTVAPPNNPPGAPSGPNPATGATGVSKTVGQVCWSASTDADGDPVTYDVAFGTTNPPAPVASGQSGTCYTTGALTGHTTHYWQVTAKDNRGGSTPGPVWSFTTANTAPTAPSTPNPANGATGVATNTQVCWTAGTDGDGDPVTYNVAFGTSNPPAAATSGQSAACYDPPGDLTAGTLYYWKATAKDAFGGATAGAVWSFTTAVLLNDPPNAPANPSPANGATGVAPTAVLSWSGSDPENDPLTYEVRFGTSNPPGTAVSSQSATSYDPPGSLPANTLHYWQIVAKDAFGGSTAGPVWSFTTANVEDIFPNVFYLSPSANVTIGGIAAQGADVLGYTKSTNTWQKVFDGSDHGLTKNISAFTLTDDGRLLFVLLANQAIAGLGTATPFDVVQFTPNTPGVYPLGAGTFSIFFQGQLKGLTAAGEKIDAIDLSGNRLLLSTGGAASVPMPGGVLKAADEDVFVYNLGTAAFEAALLIDGSKMPGMAVEDITGIWDDPQSGDYYITILGAFNLGGVKGNDKSIVRLTPNGGATVYSPSLVTWTAAGVTLPTAFKIDGLELAR